MKSRRKDRGLILLYVILLLAVVGPATWILTDTVLQSARQTRLQRVQADADNLLRSARAWVVVNRSRLLSAPEGTVFQPDPNGLDIPRAVCRITVLPKEAGQPRLQIETQTAIGRQSWRAKETITLSPR